MSGTAAGQIPAARPTKIQLSFEFDMQKQAEENNRQFQYFLCDPYPPSNKPLDDLKPIQISELRLETHHIGQALFVRTIDTPARVGAIQTLVQDSEGTAERLALYNIDPIVDADSLLPEDAVFAVKEPFLSTSTTGYTIRIDHPSDLIRLGPLSVSVPEKLIEDLQFSKKSALEWKAEGNAAYSKNDYLGAVAAYTWAVKACGENDKLIRRDILRNRAITNLFLQRYEEAVADGEAALIPADLQQDSAAVALNVKAYDRSGRAAYELGRYTYARDLFTKIAELSSSNKDAPLMLARIEERLLEQKGGYDFEKMSKSSSKRHNRLDHANFTSHTAIRDSGPRGRGLFALKSIPIGGLVMCEKALGVAFESDPSPRSCTILNHKAQRAATGTQANLLFKLTNRLCYNSGPAAEFATLFDGKTFTPGPADRVDDLVPVDTFRALGIIDYNSFGCPSVRSSSKAAQKESASQAGFHSTGLWTYASYINHACDGNAMRSFIGDMMIVRATKDIAQGEEILMPYKVADAVNAVTQQDLRKTWGFTCDCAICAAEGVTPAMQIKKRNESIEKTRSFISSNQMTGQDKVNVSKITKLERLVSELERTYDAERFKSLPRLGLIAPQLWLCQAHKTVGSRDKVIKTATALLRALGFVITTSGEKLHVERNHGLADGTAIDAAMYAASAYRSQGNLHVGQRFEDFARELYTIMNGEFRGFEERYKET